MRVPEKLEEFRTALEECYRNLRSEGSAPGQAAREAFDSLIRRIKADKADWLGLLRLPAANTIPDKMVTHICRRRLERYTAPDDEMPDGNLRAHRRVWLSGPFKVSKDGSVEDHFIWLTFATPEAPLSDDPTEMTRRLGLAHFPSGQLMYRLAFAVTAAVLYVPTCFDAGFYEAWAAAPACHAAP